MTSCFFLLDLHKQANCAKPLQVRETIYAVSYSTRVSTRCTFFNQFYLIEGYQYRSHLRTELPEIASLRLVCRKLYPTQTREPEHDEFSGQLPNMLVPFSEVFARLTSNVVRPQRKSQGN